MVKINIVNVVATTNLNHSIDLNKLQNYHQISYDPKIYGGKVAYYKSPEMQGRVSIFKTGKLISVGAKSETQSFTELNYVKIFLEENHFIVKKELQPIIRNIVATADIEHSINLEELVQKTSAIYEPEQFPAAILRIVTPFKASLLIFASGKLIVAGLNNTERIALVINQIAPILN